MPHQLQGSTMLPPTTPRSFRSFRRGGTGDGDRGRLVKRVSETRGGRSIGGAEDQEGEEGHAPYPTYRSTPSSPYYRNIRHSSPTNRIGPSSSNPRLFDYKQEPPNTTRQNIFGTLRRRASSVFRASGSTREARGYDDDLLCDDDNDHHTREGELHQTPGASAHSRAPSSSYARSCFLGAPTADVDEEEDDGRVSLYSRRDGGEIPQDGIRVWYSSYDTIDWLHDQIKDSRRVKRLRDRARTHGWRGKLINAADRATGWIVVSLIGIMTAFMAYMVIKTETLFFGLKSGYCSRGWWRTREQCGHAGWVAWHYAPSTAGGAGGIWTGWKSFTIYLFIALGLAWVSSVMTVYLTASTRFEDPTVATLAPAETASESGSKAGAGAGVGDGIAGHRGVSSACPATGDKSETMPLLSAPDNGDSECPCYSTSIPVSADINEAFPTSPMPPLSLTTQRIMYFAAGSGIPEIKTILSGFVIKGYLGAVVLFVKSLGLALSVASGMSLGKEGPMVHIACCVGNIVARQFKKYELNEAKKREVLSAACAAGVSVAFGAPLGGTLFSWEESSTYYPAKVMWRSFFCAAVAALTLRILNPYGHGRLVLLEVDYTSDHHSNFIYLIAVLLGVLGGIYGAVWARLNIAWSKRVRGGTWVKRHPIMEVAMISIVTSLASYYSPLTRIGGVEYVAELFAECHDHISGLCSRVPSDILANIGRLAHSVVIRAGLACITFGIRVPAGIFVPSLAAGAAFGRIIGLVLEYLCELYPGNPILPHRKHIVPGVYALVGASATLAGVTRTTISLVVIVVELTSNIDYVVPVALTVLVAKTVADALESDGIYDLVINMNQFPFLDAKKEHHFDRADAVDIADAMLPYLKVDDHQTVASLQNQVDNLKALGYSDGSFPCLALQGSGRDQELHVVGILALNELQHVLGALSNEPDATCNLSPSRSQACGTESGGDQSIEDITDDPYDLVPYIDLAPLLVLENSPLELVQQLFTKLGARAVIVINGRGRYRGTIVKKTWLKYLKEHKG